MLLLGSTIWFGRDYLLRGAAELWIISDPVTNGDAVAILGGGLPVRPFAAAELYKKGTVKTVVISRVAEDYLAKIGLIPGHTELNRLLLIRLGVPDNVIETFGSANQSTRDEALALRLWATQNGVSRIVIPTELFAARRVRWMFDREFAGSSVRLEVSAVEAASYSRAEWWRSSEGLIAFQNEFIKYLYYRIKY